MCRCGLNPLKDVQGRESIPLYSEIIVQLKLQMQS
jgi:hypothetical protein